MADTINWASASEASAAIDAGKLPDGFSINETGALVIPDKAATGGPFGHLVVIARFDQVITTTGRIVKSRDGILKAVTAS